MELNNSKKVSTRTNGSSKMSLPVGPPAVPFTRTGEGHIYGLDVDPIESAKTKKRLEEKGFGSDILTVKLENFANIDKVAKEAGKFDFVLADLGVSSMQIDNPDRGFTFKAEGPLDLRMNPEKGISAAERLHDISKEELAGGYRDQWSLFPAAPKFP